MTRNSFVVVVLLGLMACGSNPVEDHYYSLVLAADDVMAPLRTEEPKAHLIVGPVLLSMGLDPVWLGIMIAINLQTSFLTPPFGFARFYLRGVAPPSVTTAQIYRGVIPFVAIQLFALLLLAIFPGLVTWLPGKIYGP